jgi:hypothetical protein
MLNCCLLIFFFATQTVSVGLFVHINYVIVAVYLVLNRIMLLFMILVSWGFKMICLKTRYLQRFLLCNLASMFCYAILKP